MKLLRNMFKGLKRNMVFTENFFPRKEETFPKQCSNVINAESRLRQITVFQ